MDDRKMGDGKIADGNIGKNQVAATLGDLLDQDYAEKNPSAGKPIEIRLKM